ncbi:MAG: DUF420 domain-containing protein [Candidatus Lambdaproteobacteria bacterium]|nr:DUF420 domain-containing protein [Candidatus Lambdaproteobacteria bacterium]
MITLVKLVMSTATFCFILGYALRHRNNRLHRRWMVAGFALALAIAIVLVVGVQLFHAPYGPSFWLVELAGERGARIVLTCHRVLATVALLALIGQVVTGIRRHPLHRRLYRATIPLWLAAYVSGMFLFL